MGRKGKSSSGKMRSLVALTLVLAVAAGDMMLKKKIHHDMMVDASQAMCWGQGNMFYWKLAMMNAVEECHTGQQSNIKPANPFAQLNKPQNPFQTLPAPVQQKAVPRNPFQSANAFPKRPTVNPDSLKSILFSNFERNKRQADGLIEVTEEDFAEFLGDFSDFKDGVASKMSNLTCVLSKMNMLDADYQVNLNMLETLYGSTDNFDWSSYGLPNNKYERAAMSMKVMYGTSSPEEAFVHNFFYADPMM